jgi:ATP-dependent helicase HrpB
MPTSLPIDAHLPAARAALAQRGALVLTAEPGAGKTTRLPPALLEEVSGEVWVLEPRRLAARLAAAHVARERGCSLGGEVGYQVRHDTRAGRATRLRFVTEGILVRRLARGDGLRGVDAVVLDEFHERHVESDLALALLDRLRRAERPDLRLVVMSATLDAAPLAAHLDAPVLEVPGRVHPVTIEHAPRRDERRLEERVRDAVAALVDDGLDGHVLVFLPGAGEIERARAALGPLARIEDLALHPLHGRLSARDTDAALAASTRRKVILATNVAESSLTIDGVVAVVDSGLARVASVAPATGLRALELRPIPRASATQRAHRAGRQRPGRCLRLYTRVDLERRPQAAVPELLRADLADVLLTLRAAGVEELEQVRWLDPPPGPAVAEADALLERLGASEGGRLTDRGRRLLALPLEPRLGAVVLRGQALGIPREAAAAAALLGERSLRRGRPRPATEESDSDVLALLDLFAEAEGARFDERRLGRMGVDARAARAVALARRQILAALGRAPAADAAAEDPDDLLRRALLAGHPDRVARRLRPREPDLALARGGRARLGPESAVREAEWLLVLDAQSPGSGAGGAKVRLASAIEPDWLLDVFPDALEEVSDVRWDADRERVEASWTVRYGALVLESSPEAGPEEQVSAVLRAAALAAGPDAFCDGEALAALRLRLGFAHEHDPSLPGLDDAALADALGELCAGQRSFADLRRADLLAHVRARLGHEALRRLERSAPERVTLAGGRRCQVHYEARQPPWISSRLQDFFGMTEGPRVAGGAVPLVLHLLAPNKTAVAVTTDLAGFWERTYPVESRRLRRRYPRHAWPEDPAAAKAPRPGRVR